MVECNRDEEVRGGDGNRNRSFGFSTRCVPAAGKTPNKFYELEEFEKRYVEEGIEEDIFLEDGGLELKESGELIKFNEPIL